jgi:uracil-DNA glycosylase family protein
LPSAARELRDLAHLRIEAASCRRCPLWRNATQTVFGEGPAPAAMMLVGEQPGDKEDLAGHPFVGPAGQLLGHALEEAGIDRSAVYVTNAVKHFKNEPRGKRRLHKKPDAGEIEACRWWLEKELSLVRPRLTVALGATAAGALMQRRVTIGSVRGQAIETELGALWVTVHPSYLLRLPDETSRQRQFVRFVKDLGRAKGWLASNNKRAV